MGELPPPDADGTVFPPLLFLLSSVVVVVVVVVVVSIGGISFTAPIILLPPLRISLL